MTKAVQIFISSLCIIIAVCGCTERVTHVGEDGSVWEEICEPGFGSQNNIGIVALCSFKDSLYAATRNNVTGFEIWKMTRGQWEQLDVPGFTDSPLHEYMTNIWGDLIVFQDMLYCAVSSGYQGSKLYRSVGFEIWRTDGETWEPVISNALDEDESGTISDITDGQDDDGDTTAVITDANKAWTIDQWKNATVRILSGEGKGRIFGVVSNTENTLVIQSDEIANDENEYTICDEEYEVPGESGRPNTNYTVYPISPGDAYEIGIGEDENGMGEIWNKTIVDMETLDDGLYATIGLNYEDGTRILKTTDGVSWSPMTDYAFGLFHGFDPQGTETGTCLIEGLESRNGSPVCSSGTNFGKATLNGEETLFTGGTGSTGCNGRGARAFRLDGDTWIPIVEYYVDENDEGTNENGFGDASSLTEQNFQAWSWAAFDNKLFVGVVRFLGCRLLYTETGSTEDGAWTYAVGKDAPVPDGFNGGNEAGGAFGYGNNLGCYLYSFSSAMYAGTIVNNLFPVPDSPPQDGADLWKGVGAADSLTWTPVIENGFDDPSIVQFEAFTEFNNSLFVAGSNVNASSFPGDEEEGYSGARIFRLVSQ